MNFIFWMLRFNRTNASNEHMRWLVITASYNNVLNFDLSIVQIGIIGDFTTSILTVLNIVDYLVYLFIEEYSRQLISLWWKYLYNCYVSFNLDFIWFVPFWTLVTSVNIRWKIDGNFEQRKNHFEINQSYPLAVCLSLVNSLIHIWRFFLLLNQYFGDSIAALLYGEHERSGLRETLQNWSKRTDGIKLQGDLTQ